MLHKFLSVLTVSLLFLTTTTPSFANIKSLNGQEGQDQIFQNDSNLSITSLNDVHTLQWLGLLSVSRGGTGKSSFTNGSIPFISGGVFGEDNDNLYWDNTNKRLGIGTKAPEALLHVGGDFAQLIVGVHPNDGPGISMGADGDMDIWGQFNFLHPAGLAQIKESDNGKILVSEGLIIENDNSIGGAKKLEFDTSNLTTQDQIVTFQNQSGTVPLLESDQLFSGLNKFEADSNSTIYVGFSTKSGCIALGDSDGDGVTYITANDGVLTASATKPSICQ